MNITDTKASGDTMGKVMDDLLSVSVKEKINFGFTTSVPSFK